MAYSAPNLLPHFFGLTALPGRDRQRNVEQNSLNNHQWINKQTDLIAALCPFLKGPCGMAMARPIRCAPYGASYATVLSTRSMHPARTALLQMYDTVQPVCKEAGIAQLLSREDYPLFSMAHWPRPNEMEMTMNPIRVIIWLHCITISFGQLYLSDRPRPGRPSSRL